MDSCVILLVLKWQEDDAMRSAVCLVKLVHSKNLKVRSHQTRMKRYA